MRHIRLNEFSTSVKSICDCSPDSPVEGLHCACQDDHRKAIRNVEENDIAKPSSRIPTILDKKISKCLPCRTRDTSKSDLSTSTHLQKKNASDFKKFHNERYKTAHREGRVRYSGTSLPAKNPREVSHEQVSRISCRLQNSPVLNSYPAHISNSISPTKQTMPARGAAKQRREQLYKFTCCNTEEEDQNDCCCRMRNQPKCPFGKTNCRPECPADCNKVKKLIKVSNDNVCQTSCLYDCRLGKQNAFVKPKKLQSRNQYDEPIHQLSPECEGQHERNSSSDSESHYIPQKRLASGSSFNDAKSERIERWTQCKERFIALPNENNIKTNRLKSIKNVVRHPNQMSSKFRSHSPDIYESESKHLSKKSSNNDIPLNNCYSCGTKGFTDGRRSPDSKCRKTSNDSQAKSEGDTCDSDPLKTIESFCNRIKALYAPSRNCSQTPVKLGNDTLSSNYLDTCHGDLSNTKRQCSSRNRSAKLDEQENLKNYERNLNHSGIKNAHESKRISGGSTRNSSSINKCTSPDSETGISSLNAEDPCCSCRSLRRNNIRSKSLTSSLNRRISRMVLNAQSPRVVKSSSQKSCLKKMLIYPPSGEEGPPISLYKNYSNVDCRVKGDTEKGFRYKVTYTQKFESPVWYPDESTGSPFHKKNRCSDPYIDYG